MPSKVTTVDPLGNPAGLVMEMRLALAFTARIAARRKAKPQGLADMTFTSV
jgi:hypothetical protein